MKGKDMSLLGNNDLSQRIYMAGLNNQSAYISPTEMSTGISNDGLYSWLSTNPYKTNTTGVTAIDGTNVNFNPNAIISKAAEEEGILSGLLGSLGKIGEIGGKVGGFAQGISGLFDSYTNYKAMKDNLKTSQLQRDVMQHNLDMSRQEYARLNNQRRQYTNAYLGR